MSQQAGRCNDPFKEVFTHRYDAQRAADSMNRRPGGDSGRKVRPYECAAGHWHVTGTPSAHSSPRKQRLRERN